MNVKRKVRFVVPNLGAKSRKGVKDRWRHQRGIDNHKREKRGGYGEMPRIGWKNTREQRNLGADGRARILVHNRAELMEAVKMPNVSIIFSKTLSARSRIALQSDADKHGAKVANRVKQ